MRKNKIPGGKVVATASVAGIYPHESYPEYDGAKAGVSLLKFWSVFSTNGPGD
jgi:NAD(P)-dependent dehydrogenase (short-subunit alcohol dehydrogenase family)